MSEHRGPWRTGRKVGRTIYDADDRLIGVMDTPELARVAAAAPKLLALARYAAERGEGDAEMAEEILREIDGP